MNPEMLVHHSQSFGRIGYFPIPYCSVESMVTPLTNLLSSSLSL